MIHAELHLRLRAWALRSGKVHNGRLEIRVADLNGVAECLPPLVDVREARRVCKSMQRCHHDLGPFQLHSEAGWLSFDVVGALLFKLGVRIIGDEWHSLVASIQRFLDRAGEAPPAAPALPAPAAEALVPLPAAAALAKRARYEAEPKETLVNMLLRRDETIQKLTAEKRSWQRKTQRLAVAQQQEITSATSRSKDNQETLDIVRKGISHVTAGGGFAIAIRKALSNVSAAGFGAAAMDKVSANTVIRHEIFAQPLW